MVLLYGKANPSVLIGSFLVGILPYGPLPWLCIFCFRKPENSKTSMARVPYNKLLTNLASSSRTGEYWPSVVFVLTSLRSVRTATTSGQYSPVRPSRSVSKRLLPSEKDKNKAKIQNSSAKLMKTPLSFSLKTILTLTVQDSN